MGIKKFRPLTPSQRYRMISDFSEITTDKPEKSLLEPLNRTGGRNSHGHVTSRHRGGGHKRRYRVIDFRRDKLGITAKVLSIEYDPNRSARIALLCYADGEKRYILAPHDVKVGDVLESGPNAEIRAGNAMPLAKIPTGSNIHNVELKIGKGGQLARGAGTYIQLMAKDGDNALLRMPSGEMRLVNQKCYATLGQVGNIDHENIVVGKAGATRWKGRRPKVRGVAMNPVDHPMGGGEGKASGGRHPVSPWGQQSKGYRTRKKNSATQRFIVRRRKSASQ